MKPEDRYEVRIRWSEEDNAFVADFPELPSSGPGLRFSGALGETRQEALTNAEAQLHEMYEAERAGREGPLRESASAALDPEGTPRPTVGGPGAPNTTETDKKDARKVGIDLDQLGDL